MVFIGISIYFYIFEALQADWAHRQSYYDISYTFETKND